MNNLYFLYVVTLTFSLKKYKLKWCQKVLVLNLLNCIKGIFSTVPYLTLFRPRGAFYPLTPPPPPPRPPLLLSLQSWRTNSTVQASLMATTKLSDFSKVFFIISVFTITAREATAGRAKWGLKHCRNLHRTWLSLGWPSEEGSCYGHKYFCFFLSNLSNWSF